MDSSKLRNAGFALPRSSDEVVRFAISQIIQWLASRTSPQDNLCLPSDAKPVS
jgi:hypothetical protein